MKFSLLNLPVHREQPPSGEWKVYSPTRSTEVIGTCQYRYSDIELAIQGAGIEKEKITGTSREHRKQVVLAAGKRLFDRKAEVNQVAQNELGRTAQDLAYEWNELESLFDSLSQNPIEEQWVARGTAAVIGSSVWPIYYSAQFIFLNFLAGNPVILKPSEKSSLTVLKLATVLRELSPELMAAQILLGDREVGRRLICHEQVQLVIFQGSFEVGMRVRQDTSSQPSKEVLLFLGAKNPSIVFKDAPETVAETLILDAYSGAGQDCQSVSIIFVENSILANFTRQFHELSKNFKIGAPEEEPLMGPLIDASMMDRYFKFIGISEREGAQVLMRGKILERKEKGNFVTPSIVVFPKLDADQVRKSVSLQTEILSPHVSIIGFDSEAELLALVNKLNHGRCLSLWTHSPERAKNIADQVEYGCVVLNASTRKRGALNFQAKKRSGNHAISGLGLLAQLVTIKSVQI